MNAHRIAVRIVLLALLASCRGSQLGQGGGAAGTGETGQAGAGGTGGRITGSAAGSGGDIVATGSGTAGTGGAAGTGGGFVNCASGGTTGSAGDGGSPGLSICPPPAPACGTAVCGNGQLDQCQKELTAACLARTDVEPCDGDNLGGASCQSLHFGSGTLACGSACTMDTSGCRACRPLGDGLVGCGEAPLPANQAWSVAVAATDAEVGLAWLGRAGDVASVSFARLSPGLERIASQALDSGPPSCAGAWKSVAAAAVASGWLVAVGGNPEVIVYALDAGGRQIARIVIDRPAQYGYYYFDPVLVARPEGGALLVWQTTTGVLASLIAADGRSATQPINLSDAGVQVSGGLRAVYLGDAYYVIGYGGSLEYVAVRVSSDGRVVAPANLLPRGILWFVQATAGASDFRLLSLDATDNLVFERIAPDGRPIVAATKVGSLDTLGDLIMAAYGDDTLILNNAAHRLSIGRLTPDGTYRAAARDIAGIPPEYHVPLSATLRGPDFVIAWIDDASPSGIDAARYTP